MVPLDEVVRGLLPSSDSLADLRHALADLVLPGGGAPATADLLACRCGGDHAALVFRPGRHQEPAEWDRREALAETTLRAHHPGLAGTVGRFIQSRPGLDLAAAIPLAAAQRIFEVAAAETGTNPRVKRAEALVDRRLHVAQSGVTSADGPAFQQSVRRYQRSARLGVAVRSREERLARERLLRLSPRVLDL